MTLVVGGGGIGGIGGNRDSIAADLVADAAGGHFPRTGGRCQSGGGSDYPLRPRQRQCASALRFGENRNELERRKRQNRLYGNCPLSYAWHASLPALAQVFAIPLHHPAALIEILGAVVRSPDLVALAMGSWRSMASGSIGRSRSGCWNPSHGTMRDCPAAVAHVLHGHR